MFLACRKKKINYNNSICKSFYGSYKPLLEKPNKLFINGIPKRIRLLPLFEKYFYLIYIKWIILIKYIEEWFMNWRIKTAHSEEYFFRRQGLVFIKTLWGFKTPHRVKWWQLLHLYLFLIQLQAPPSIPVIQL